MKDKKMITAYKKSSSLLLAVMLLTSLNCLAMEKRATMPNGNYLNLARTNTVPSARNFYTNSWRNIKGYGPSTVLGAASAGALCNVDKFPIDARPLVIFSGATLFGLSAHNISSAQYNNRLAQDPKKERGSKLWYFVPAVAAVALGGLAGLGYCVYNGESVPRNLATATLNGVRQGAFYGSLFGLSGICWAGLETFHDSKKEAYRNADMLAGRDEKGKEEEKIYEAVAVDLD